MIQETNIEENSASVQLAKSHRFINKEVNTFYYEGS